MAYTHDQALKNWKSIKGKVFFKKNTQATIHKVTLIGDNHCVYKNES